MDIDLLSEAKVLQARIQAQAERACTPLYLAKAQGDDMPVPFEVGRNGDRRLVIHFFRRPDLSKQGVEPVVAAVMLDVFGRPVDSMRKDVLDENGRTVNVLGDVFFRDEKKIKESMGLPRQVMPADSWYVEFPDGFSSLLPDSDTLRDRIALSIKQQWVVKGPG